MIKRLALVILLVLLIGAMALPLPGCVMLPGKIAHGLSAASARHLAAGARGTVDQVISAARGQDCVLLRPALLRVPCRDWPDHTAEE